MSQAWVAGLTRHSKTKLGAFLLGLRRLEETSLAPALDLAVLEETLSWYFPWMRLFPHDALSSYHHQSRVGTEYATKYLIEIENIREPLVNSIFEVGFIDAKGIHGGTIIHMSNFPEGLSLFEVSLQEGRIVVVHLDGALNPTPSVFYDGTMQPGSASPMWPYAVYFGPRWPCQLVQVSAIE